MNHVVPTNRAPTDDIEALAYVVHFAEAFQHGATLCRPDGTTVFISPELVRAAVQAEAA